MTLRDNPHHYGTVSRVLHWAMAALFVWQFSGMALKLILGRVPLMAFWVGTHPSVGTALLLLLLLRAAWAFVERGRRPAYQADRLGRLAALGHMVLYGLMFIIPALALARMVGSGRGVRLFGMQLKPPTGEEIGWMTAPGDLIHGKLAWLLLFLIAGHVAMVVVHQWRGESVLRRMIGARLPS
ncbi:MAG TPA: cytochrome b [Sphingobium sp.]|nr:cytochrome b [Sphingobium sp.]